MTARSPNALFLSLLIHGAVAAAFLISAYALKDSATQATQEFILVAGPGNNYEAKEAPALGVPGGVKIDFPAPAPSAVAPTPAPVAPAPIPEPVPAYTPPAPTPPADPISAAPVKQEAPITKTPDFSKVVKRTADRREKAIMTKYKKEQAAIAEAEKKAADAAKKQMTYEDFLKTQKNNPSPKATTTTATSSKTPRIDPSGLVNGLRGGKGENQGAGGTALSREEQDMLGTYFAALKLRLKEAHEKPMGVSDLLHATAEFYISAEGTITQVRILQSSGNAEFDQSVLAAFRNIPAMGRRPDGRGDTRNVEFRMKEED